MFDQEFFVKFSWICHHCQEFTKKHYIVVIEKPVAWGYWDDDSLPYVLNGPI